MSLAYRSDIDGLRAIAVGSVVLFHARIPPFTGGYIGVDVFFVISGFLITSILHQEMTAGTYSLVDFYDRRIRRIFPALFLMMAVTTLFAALILMPRQMQGYVGTLVPSALFFANIHFESLLNYFGPAADEVPLLHLWSLAVEEQFYIFFPLVLFVLMKLGGRRLAVGVLALIAVASLTYAESIVESEQSAAFFLLQSRAWELLAARSSPWSRCRACRKRPRHGSASPGRSPSSSRCSPSARKPSSPACGPCRPCWRGGDHHVRRLRAERRRRPRAQPEGHGLCGPHLLRALSVALAHAGAHRDLEGAAHHLYRIRHRDPGGRRHLRPVAEICGGAAPARQRAGRATADAHRRRACAILLTVGVALALQKVGRGVFPISPLGAAAEAAADDRSAFQRRCNNNARFWTPDQMQPIALCAAGPGAAKGSYDVLVWGDSHAGATFLGLAEVVEKMGLTRGSRPWRGARRSWAASPGRSTTTATSAPATSPP